MLNSSLVIHPRDLDDCDEAEIRQELKSWDVLSIRRVVIKNISSCLIINTSSSQESENWIAHHHSGSVHTKACTVSDARHSVTARIHVVMKQHGSGVVITRENVSIGTTTKR